MTTDSVPKTHPSAWQILIVWLSIGAQSFGGGAATLALIRQSVVVKQLWLTDAEFTELWALCQITPGINLLAITILIGRRLAGGWGMAASLLGLLLPSVLATTLITASYARFAHLRVVEAGLRGVIPAVVGISLVTAFNMAHPPLLAARSESKVSLGIACLILACSAAAFSAHVPVVLILVTGGMAGGFAKTWQARRGRAS